ncbi:MAG: hypothetical protein ACQETE_05470 [Bacteroidota bacterium]
MKNLSIFIFLFCNFVGLQNQGIAQDRINYITEAQYHAVTFNGITISQLNATNGQSQALQQLLGNTSSVKDGQFTKTFIWGSNKIHFRYDKEDTNGKITRLEIKGSSWPVTIKGYSVRVGDSETSLQQKFGQDLKILHSKIGDPVKFVAFNYPNHDYSGISINISPFTNDIVKIIYFVSP